MCIVGGVYDAALGYGFVKAGPATPTFKFGVAFEKGIATSGAIIGPYLLESFKPAGPGALCALLAGDIIHIRIQDLLPFRIGKFKP
jgi:hypothetical protein